MDLANLAKLYREGLTPSALIEGILGRIDARGDDHVWIHRLSRDALMATARSLEAKGPAGMPLYGAPFAIKDNIDLAGAPTTAACPPFAYVARESATVVRRLVDAGAIPIGKTNLDQFATGLNGTRSPYGAPASALSAEHVSGGSSSGSAVAVAAGLVSFSLGTDTAGSGRVPAAFNNLVGLKPTKGLISTHGVVPACRSLDCVSIFALTADDARDVLAVAGGFDAIDPFSRASDEPRRSCPREIRGARFGVPKPRQLNYFGNAEGARLFDAMLRRIQKMGGELVEIDFAPFLETARLLYEGPWVAERYVAIRDFIDRHPDALFPVTRQIIGGGAKPLAADAFAAYYRLKELQRVIEPVWRQIDVLVTPTAGRHYTIAEMLADPIRLNSNLGYYTNFMNLLDLAAVAAPAGLQSDGLAFGVTLAAPAWSDQALCALADALHREQNLKLGALGHHLPPKRAGRASASPSTVRLAVCGAHMSGLPLNHQLTERGARLHRRCRTAPTYRLFALPGGPPARPGLLRVDNGRAIEVEVWEVPIAAFGSFVAGIPAPLGIGSLELEDGETVKGFICEAHGVKGARDITDLGGWRRYLMAEQQPA
ncbi:MAG TPA: allophanate hydrolase [Roseiarcus sp.]|nr:allophanate hydrolase [Roseiarcus sp.]